MILVLLIVTNICQHGASKGREKEREWEGEKEKDRQTKERERERERYEEGERKGDERILLFLKRKDRSGDIKG